MTAPVTVEIGEDLTKLINDRSNSLILKARRGLAQVAKWRSPPGPQTFKVKKNYGPFLQKLEWRR